MTFINILNTEHTKGMDYLTLTRDFTYEEFLDFSWNIQFMEDLRRGSEEDQKSEQKREEIQRKAENGEFNQR